MTRKEFMRQRAIADYIKQHGVTKTRPGQAKNADYMAIRKTARRGCSESRELTTVRQDDPFTERVRRGGKGAR